MTKYLLIAFLLVITDALSQVVFFPPGAQWNYVYLNQVTKELRNEKVVCTGTTISGSDTIKILSLHSFFYNCPVLTQTLIKQRGDTVFFKNSYTKNEWQILYNFNIQPGHGWQTTVQSWYSSLPPTTYAFTVDSINFVYINNQKLKRLYTAGSEVIERVGFRDHLFMFGSGDGCHTTMLNGLVCYKDNYLGVYQVDSRPCDYSGIVSISEHNLNSMEVFPNPANNFFTIKFNSKNSGITNKLRLLSVTGELCKEISLSGFTKELILDITALHPGTYLLLFTNDREHFKKIIIKE